MKIDNFCVSGASISKCPWITWVDFMIKALAPEQIINHSCKGAGNDYIITSGLHAIQNKTSPLLTLMLTNFDKFDMWVSGEKCHNLSNEKHPPTWIDGTPAIDEGFWCTGSHFPLSKKIYQDEFFDLGHSATLSMHQILSLHKYCEYYQIPCIILFDSPILQISESRINDIAKKNSAWVEDLNLQQIITIKPLLPIIEQIVVDTRGLIGFCLDNNLPWYNHRYGPHPPSESHLAYFQIVIKPWIEKKFPNLVLYDIGPDFEKISDWMTDKWKKMAF